MQGIQALLKSNSIDPTNVGFAARTISNLSISLEKANDLISTVFELDEDEHLPILNNLDEARTLLGLVVQSGLQKDVDTFSLGAFKTFYNHTKAIRRDSVTAQTITIYKDKIPKNEPVSVVSIVACENDPDNDPVSPDIEPDIPTPINNIPLPIEPAIIEPAVVAPMQAKGKRNRKVDPTSNLSRAKVLYAGAADKSRNAFVTQLQNELGIEQGTATTYYYIARKG